MSAAPTCLLRSYCNCLLIRIQLVEMAMVKCRKAMRHLRQEQFEQRVLWDRMHNKAGWDCSVTSPDTS